jgi:hypothetical protein
VVMGVVAGAVVGAAAGAGGCWAESGAAIATPATIAQRSRRRAGTTGLRFGMFALRGDR